MAFNTNTFRKNLVSLANPAHFEIRLSGFNNINIFNKKELAVIDKIPYRAFSSQIPGSYIDTVDRTYSGPRRAVPVGIQFQPIPIMIYEPKTYVVRQIFDKWHKYIANIGQAWNVPYYDNCIAQTLNLTTFDKLGNAVVTYIMHEVYPISVTPIQVDWSYSNSYVVTNVEFQYHRWDVNYHQQRRSEPLD